MPFALDDLSLTPKLAQEGELDRILAEEAERTFDLSEELPVFVRLVRLGGDEHVLSVVMHHVASDGWSFVVLFKELASLYGAYLRDQPSPLPELPVQYYDYSAWQRDWVEGPTLEKQLDYWIEQLSGQLPVCEVPTDFARTPKHTFDGGQVTLSLPGQLSDALRELEPQPGRDALHDPALGVQGAHPTPHGSGRGHRRHAGGRPGAPRAGGHDRHVPQHARAAHRPGRRPTVPQSCWSGSGT